MNLLDNSIETEFSNWLIVDLFARILKIEQSIGSTNMESWSHKNPPS